MSTQQVKFALISQSGLKPFLFNATQMLRRMDMVMTNLGGADAMIKKEKSSLKE
jgi:hypothetical protein